MHVVANLACIIYVFRINSATEIIHFWPLSLPPELPTEIVVRIGLILLFE